MQKKALAFVYGRNETRFLTSTLIQETIVEAQSLNDGLFKKNPLGTCPR